MRKTWTSEEEDWLVKNYDSVSAQELQSRFPGVTYHAIKGKAAKLGLNKRRIPSAVQEAVLRDYAAGLPVATLASNHSVGLTSIYRMLEKCATARRNAPFFRITDEEQFKKDYQTLTNRELREKYQQVLSYGSLRARASTLGITRPKELLYKKLSEIHIAKEQLYTDYIELNLTSQQIAEKHGVAARSGISARLRKLGIIKPLSVLTQQRADTMEVRTGHPFSISCYGKTEKAIGAWLQEGCGKEFKSSRDILDGREIDLYNDELKLGIEYCGLRWHNEGSPEPRGRRYHYDKYLGAVKKDVRLITIFENEWTQRSAQVKNFLKSVVRANTIKLHGRKCVVREITKSEGRVFFEKHHIQGKNALGRHFAGLFHDDVLVGAMSFGRHHRIAGNTVLDRLCFAEDTTISGGASKLFKFLLQVTKSKEVVSWSDNRWSAGAVYRQLGFVCAEEFGPDYSYVNMKAAAPRLSKQSQKKNSTGCPENKTEREWCQERGLYRIWDCGKIRWEFSAPDAIPA